jgi:hypothetical protein
MKQPLPLREQHGFQRTRCDCEFCRAPCRHVPGGLDPSDLPRLCPEGRDVFAWAEEHLRALAGRSYSTLVPARQADGSCHWLFAGRCAVHDNAPYGCAFFDSHMSEVEVERRYAATVQARREDAAANGLYYRVWLHLCGKGLIGQPGDREALAQEQRRLRQSAERTWQRLEGNP